MAVSDHQRRTVIEVNVFGPLRASAQVDDLLFGAEGETGNAKAHCSVNGVGHHTAPKHDLSGPDAAVP